VFPGITIAYPSDKALLSRVRMCDMSTYGCLQLVNCDVLLWRILKPPPWCKTDVLFHWRTVKGMLCVLGKGRLQWINKQRAECYHSRRINVCLITLKIPCSAKTAIHPIACYCNIAIYRGLTTGS